MASRQAWDALAQRIYAKGVDVFDSAEVLATEAGAREPRVVALTLLARTLRAMAATNLLLDDGFTVEARTLTRTVLENLFFISALAKNGAAFVAELELDDITARRKRAKGLLDFFAKNGEQTEQHARLESYRDQLWEEHGKTSEIQMRAAALAGGVDDALIVYRELSTDAAHPTASSLSLHIVPADDNESIPFSISATPVMASTEIVDTLELLCMATLGVLVSACEIIGETEIGERLDVLADAYAALSGSDSGVGTI